jgi:anti-sigma regulatory factor (Ser/Thr protein kinase)
MMRTIIGEAVIVFGFDQQTARDVVLAVSEAVSNVISHCYCGRCEPVTLRCLLHADRLEIRLRDFGPKPDPATLKGRELEDLRPGGLGIHIMRQTMDEIDYDLSPATGTELKMVKYRAGGPPETEA